MTGSILELPNLEKSLELCMKKRVKKKKKKHRMQFSVTFIHCGIHPVHCDIENNICQDSNESESKY